MLREWEAMHAGSMALSDSLYARWSVRLLMAAMSVCCIEGKACNERRAIGRDEIITWLAQWTNP